MIIENGSLLLLDLLEVLFGLHEQVLRLVSLLLRSNDPLLAQLRVVVELLGGESFEICELRGRNCVIDDGVEANLLVIRRCEGHHWQFDIARLELVEA